MKSRYILVLIAAVLLANLTSCKTDSPTSSTGAKSSFELIEHLEKLGAEVDYHDPHVPQTHKMRHHDLQMHSVEFSAQKLKTYDCVLIATHHAAYDWQLVTDHAKLIIDTRNALRNVKGSRSHIVSA